MKKFIIIFFSISIIFLSFACSLSKPTIAELSVKRLEIENDSDLLIERLSVFLLFRDEDEREDYNSILVIHKESGLSWSLNRNNSSFFVSEDVSKEELKKRIWVGSNKISYPLGKMPLGEYSIIVEDLAGNRAISSIILRTETEFSKIPFSFTSDGSTWKITNNTEASFNNYSLILLGADKQPIYVKSLGNINSEEFSGELLSLKEEYADARYIQCLVENSQKTIAYLSKSYKIY